MTSFHYYYKTQTALLKWSADPSGELTAKTAFQFLRPHAPIVAWGKSIWSKFIMPRMSLLAWRILHGRVLSDDFLQKRGVSLVSRCGLCCRSVESLNHIFLNCPFAASVWNYMVTKFGSGPLPGSILEVFQLGLHASRSNQLRELYMVIVFHFGTLVHLECKDRTRLNIMAR